MRIACLCATNRPEWRPWVMHQFEKQVYPDKELLLDSSDDSIPEKRTRLIQTAKKGGFDAIAWFDDDDWSSPKRLLVFAALLAMGATPLSAVGNVRSYFVRAERRLVAEPGELVIPDMAISYQAPEGIIFNGAVFLLSTCPDTFSRALQTGEDTDWLMRWHKRRPSYVITAERLHLWMCHRKNVTNRLDTRSFTEVLPAGLITEEEWKLIPR